MKIKKQKPPKKIKPSINEELQSYVRIKVAQGYGELKNNCLRFFPELSDCFPTFNNLTTDDILRISGKVEAVDEFMDEATRYKKKDPNTSIYYPDYYFSLGMMHLESAVNNLFREKPYNALNSLLTSTKNLNIYFTYLNQYYYTTGKIRNLDTITIVPPKIIEDIIIKKLGTSAATKKRLSHTTFRRSIVEQIANKFGWGKHSLNRMAQIVLDYIKSDYSQKIKERDIETYKRDLRALKYRSKK